jgi:hypothetical protein
MHVPSLAICVFDITGKASGIHERRALEPRAQLSTKFCKALQIVAERDRGTDECCIRLCGQIGQVKVEKLAVAAAADAGAAHSSHHWHAHPESVKAGGVAIVGDRIQPKIDIVIGAQVFNSGPKLDKIDALCRNVESGETLQ